MTAPTGARMPHPLRIRLVLVATALLAVALVGTGIASAVIMHRNLSEQLESNLIVATGAAIVSLDAQVTDASQLRSADDLLWLYLQGPGSFQLLLTEDGRVLGSSYLDAAFDYSTLTAEQERALVGQAADPSITSTTLPGLGSVVVVASPLMLTRVGGDYILVNGSTTESVDSTMREFIGTTIVIGVLALLTVTVAGYWVIRGSLRPLQRVVDRADEVIAMPLSMGEITLPARAAVPPDARSEAGRVTGALTRLLDHVEEALNTRHRAEESMRRFIADASHELKNPLASIRGYADHYRHDPDTPPPTRDALERINSEAVRMSKLVSDLLLLARMDVPAPPHPVEVDASRVVLEIVADARVTFPDHLWRIDIPEEPVILDSDDAALRQILLNLTTNAGTHTPAGTTATVGIERAAGAVRITVRDDGPGIPSAVLGSVFEPFTQNNQTPHQRQAGSVGLGLTIAQRLSQWLGGSLTASSEPHDTRFVVALPQASPR